MPDIRPFLKTHGIHPKKGLGQHFLVDDDVLETIVETAGIGSRDHVVEIGPGIGVLTSELLTRAGRVTAIELDEQLIPLLQKYVNKTGGRLTVVAGNALETPMPETSYKIVANIPYHITSPLLRHVFLESLQPPAALTLLIQKEVAQRICEKKNRSQLTILVQLFGTPHFVRTVPAKAFLPPPKVDSAILHVDCFSEPIADPETIEQVFKLTRIAFMQKRKMLRNSFGTFPGGPELLTAAAIDEKRRPQTLSVEEWLRLAEAARQDG